MFSLLLIFQHIWQSIQQTHEISEGTNVLFCLKNPVMSLK